MTTWSSRLLDAPRETTTRPRNPARTSRRSAGSKFSQRSMREPPTEASEGGLRVAEPPRDPPQRASRGPRSPSGSARPSEPRSAQRRRRARPGPLPETSVPRRARDQPRRRRRDGAWNAKPERRRRRRSPRARHSGRRPGRDTFGGRVLAEVGRDDELSARRRWRTFSVRPHPAHRAMPCRILLGRESARCGGGGSAHNLHPIPKLARDDRGVCAFVAIHAGASDTQIDLVREPLARCGVRPTHATRNLRLGNAIGSQLVRLHHQPLGLRPINLEPPVWTLRYP